MDTGDWGIYQVGIFLRIYITSVVCTMSIGWYHCTTARRRHSILGCVMLECEGITILSAMSKAQGSPIQFRLQHVKYYEARTTLVVLKWETSEQVCSSTVDCNRKGRYLGRRGNIRKKRIQLVRGALAEWLLDIHGDPGRQTKYSAY